MSNSKKSYSKYFPASTWLTDYNFSNFKSDLLSSVIVIAMLVPQGMAYAMLAGLPPITGLYASMLPMIVYAFFGSSPTLSIGPVAIISMMTFATLTPFFEVGSEAYIQAACLLAMMVGIISFLLGIFKFGFLIQLISHPVIHSFIIASALLIALGQIKFLLDIPLQSNNILELIVSFYQHANQTHWGTLLFGVVAMLLLIYMPKLFNLAHIQQRFKFSGFLIKAIPLLLVVLSIALVSVFQLENSEIKTVGEIPSGFPPLSVPNWNWDLALQLLPGASMIAMISFVESLSIAQATALQQRSALNSNQELIALGLSNLSAGISSAFPVTGSLSRTVVNADAGAKTPMAGILSSCFIVVVSLFFTGFFKNLPLAILAVTIMVSIWKLVDLKPFFETWHYSKADGIAMWITFFGVICIDISTGLILGVISTFMLMLWRISRPHMAVIGLVEGTQHFRNQQRYPVKTVDSILSLRIDEGLNFLNASSFKSFFINAVSEKKHVQFVVVNCSGVSSIDYSALEVLEELDAELNKLNIQLHLSEVKGPVMDKLIHSRLYEKLDGRIHLTHYQAIQTLNPEFLSST
ncbi:SulP family inorganic anion transporter [Acinetobacter sp. ANC 4178]|uniref:SulP family inorganic anion transporter n=1 Tax=Acinetobacter sp. ANC 4178 TaxID=2529839 RepID=UPI001040D1C3|nr:sulfate permease [Acinetobacter sp. ANC 4178]TCB66308.1 sulfate permease [Acinetobacter sp. ANC 4178]